MKVCQGYWPNALVSCHRILDENGKCPKLHDPHHLEASTFQHRHSVIDVESCVTGEIIAHFCPECDERVD